MNDSAHDRLRELLWRRRLTEAEESELQALLQAHPEAREDLECEVELNRLLEQLPQAPAVASNFTALVLQAVERENAATGQASRRSGWGIFQRWLTRAAVASLAMVIGLFAYERHEQNVRATMARQLAEFTEIVSASNPEVLQDFEPIRRLSDPEPKADTELLALY